ncbi:MAG: hypothetical protein K6B41_08580 [Butyrivibrio sp.]|nr:hypothetical protein [Butyrivibrio sp.]
MLVYTKLFAAFFLMLCIILCMFSLIVKNEKKLIYINNIVLLLASTSFFLYAGVKAIWFLIYIILITYVGGLLIYRQKKLFIILVPLLLAPLLVFKLLDFGGFTLAQPLGISFVTLQSFTYIYAVFKGDLKPDKNFLKIALFVSFFPCVSSGPIMEAGVLLPQFEKKIDFDYDRVTDGIKLYAWGIAKKLILADNMAIYINGVKDSVGTADNSGVALLMVSLLYSFQLYFDFSGYSDIVIGCAKILGYDLIQNFDHPYLSRTVTEFWNRWHISLSGWLKKYIYFPLGGSRVDRFRIYRNVMIVFIVSGFWHGNGFHFIVWGLLHGAFVCAERMIRERKPGYKGNIFITYLTVTFAWIFFASNNISEALITIRSFAKVPSELFKFFTGQISGGIEELLLISDMKVFMICVIGLVLFIFISFKTRNKDGLSIVRNMPILLRWTGYYALILVILFFASSEHVNFIYNSF